MTDYERGYMDGLKVYSPFPAVPICTETPPDDLHEPKLLGACVTARGALRLDVMLDDNGKPFGTTVVALEALDAAIAATEER